MSPGFIIASLEDIQEESSATTTRVITTVDSEMSFDKDKCCEDEKEEYERRGKNYEEEEKPPTEKILAWRARMDASLSPRGKHAVFLYTASRYTRLTACRSDLSLWSVDSHPSMVFEGA